MTIRTKFLQCFAVRAVWNALQPQISVINVVSNLIESGLSKAASSVDKEKLLKECFIGDILTQLSLVCWKNVMEHKCTWRCLKGS